MKKLRKIYPYDLDDKASNKETDAAVLPPAASKLDLVMVRCKIVRGKVVPATHLKLLVETFSNYLIIYFGQPFYFIQRHMETPKTCKE